MSIVTTVKTPTEERLCSIDRTLGIIGDRWSFLILREALITGITRYADFENILGVAPNILSSRLARMAEAGVLEKREYREAGSRPRMSYHPTEAGRQLLVVLAAMQQWGDDFIPPTVGVTQERHSRSSHKPVRVGFVEDDKALLPVDDVQWVNTDSYPKLRGFKNPQPI